MKTTSYSHNENISLDSEPNGHYLMKVNSNSQIYLARLYVKTPWSYEKESGVTSLPLTSTAKISTKIQFSADKIYYNFSQ